MEETIILQLRAFDFAGSTYTSCEHCPVANAARRQTGKDDVAEGVNAIFIGDTVYEHDTYSPGHCWEDSQKAKLADFSMDTVIREIIIKRNYSL